MKTLVRFAVPVAAALLLVAAAATPASASCASPRLIENIQVTIHTPGGPHPPDGGSTTPDLKGTFWSFNGLPGGGNPAPALGVDNGSTAQDNWLGWPGYTGADYYPAHIVGPGPDGNYDQSHWAATGVDGCIDTDGSSAAVDDPQQCMVILLTDDDDNGNGYFAVASTPSQAGTYDFAQATGGGPITLAPIPKPNILGSVRNGANSVDLTLNVSLGAGPAGGLYLGCQGAAIQGARYLLWVRDQANASPAPNGPDSRSTSNWTPAPGGPTPVGQARSLNVACGGVDREFYICATLQLPTGNGQFFDATTCSNNSTRVECGPNLAEPEMRRPTGKPTLQERTGSRR